MNCYIAERVGQGCSPFYGARTCRWCRPSLGQFSGLVCTDSLSVFELLTGVSDIPANTPQGGVPSPTTFRLTVAAPAYRAIVKITQVLYLAVAYSDFRAIGQLRFATDSYCEGGTKSGTLSNPSRSNRGIKPVASDSSLQATQLKHDCGSMGFRSTVQTS
jgi:hypothetical protein